MAYPLSFREIQDEEFAKKLQAEFNIEDNNAIVSPDTMTDEEYAKYLHEALNGTDNPIWSLEEPSDDASVRGMFGSRKNSENGDSSDEDIDYDLESDVPTSKKENEILNRFPELQDLDGVDIGNTAYNQIHEISRMTRFSLDVNKRIGKSKDNMRTHSKVLDTKTLLFIHKLINNGSIDKLGSVIATGKEAVIYSAVTTNLLTLTDHNISLTNPTIEPVEIVAKIFKTTLTDFKNRAEYIEGDHRFSGSDQKNKRAEKIGEFGLDEEDEEATNTHRERSYNSDKMIELWADKEFKNLIKIHEAGVSSPKPFARKKNMVFMEYIGTLDSDGYCSPAPTLREIKMSLSVDKLNRCYTQVLDSMIKMYTKCKLVHADLSPYNILYRNGSVYIIDVSSAVDISHPKAMEFLRRDCEQIHNYFYGIEGLNNVMNIDHMMLMITGPENPIDLAESEDDSTDED
jgi:serine/threonine-protein kinase RIO1